MNSIPISTILKTDRLRLRAISLSDTDLVWSASRVLGFNDGMAWEPPENKEELIPIAKQNIRAWEEGKSFTFTIELAETSNPIGRIVIRCDDNPSIWDIGFWVHPDYWSRGYATEAARAIIDFGMNELSALKITAAHATWNTPSKRVIKKLGFRFTGENPCGFVKRGNPVPEYEYVIEATVF